MKMLPSVRPTSSSISFGVLVSQCKIKSLKSGAFEFIQKPFDQERLMNFVNRAVENFKLKNQNTELEAKLFHSYELIGDSSNIEKIKEQI